MLLLAGVCLVRPVQAASILPFDEVAAGMTGVGRTVFSGTRIETFDVEILGKLPNVGPGQDLILARLSGGPLERTGVLAGMSGSPVTIGDRLVGAVAYTWGFSTEPIAGITPIEQVLSIADLEGGAVPRTTTARISSRTLDRLLAPDDLPAFFSSRWETLLTRPAGMRSSLPLAISGLGPGGIARVASDFAGTGFLPLQAGSAGEADPAEGLPLRAGSAMGLRLVGGDVDMTATGTVTWVEGDRVLGFGHPMFGLGAVDLPMTAARVETLLPSLVQSARIATPLAEVGAVRQDRASGVAGRTGVRPRTIPVRLQLAGGSVGEESFSFEVADDPLLSPLLLYASLNGILASRERVLGNATVRLREGSVIKMIGSPDVELDNVFAGPAAFEMGTGLPAYVLHLLMNNAWTQPQIAGVNLLLDYDEVPRTAHIRRVILDRYRVRPGESVEVGVVLGPYRGAERVMTRTIVVPPETPPGRLTIAVGGALAISRASSSDEPVLPRDLDQLIWLINRLRRNDRVYILATHEDGGLLVSGARLPNLPPSAASLLTRPERSGEVVRVGRRSILEEVVPAEFAVEGSARVQLEMEIR